MLIGLKGLFFEKKFGWLDALFVRSSCALKLKDKTFVHSFPLVQGKLEISSKSFVLPRREEL